MSKWTPGKWEVGNDGWNADHIYCGENRADKTNICQVFGIPMHTRLSEVDSDRYANGLANARLIAAAPEMAELIQKMLDRSGQLDPFTEQEARALLEKVNG